MKSGYLRLAVDGGVPVGVVEDDGVSAGEVESDASGARGADEEEELGVAVEVLDERLAELGLGGAVEADVGEVVEAEGGFEDIQHLRHLSLDAEGT